MVETMYTKQAEFSKNFGSNIRRTLSLSDLNTTYLSGSSPDVSARQQQVKNKMEATTQSITTIKIRTMFPFSRKEINSFV